MSRYFGSLGRACKRSGPALKGAWKKVADKVKQAKRKIRKHRLFAKTKEMRKRLTSEVADLVGHVQKGIATALESATRGAGLLKGWSKAALVRACELHDTMSKLLPQIRSWLKTGQVAKGKIVSLHMPQVASIVRGKSGKKVEFGWRWGLVRLGGGFLLGRSSRARSELTDSQFAVEAVQMVKQVTDRVPERYAYDRGGYSQANGQALKEMGVAQVGLAPRGKGKWLVRGSASGGTCTGADEGRGEYWRNQEHPIWVQPARCANRRHDEILRAARCGWIQSEQAGQGTGQPGRSGGDWLKRSCKTIDGCSEMEQVGLRIRSLRIALWMNF
jgi:hypothetical protein